jgi:hypothetical protein
VDLGSQPYGTPVRVALANSLGGIGSTEPAQ